MKLVIASIVFLILGVIGLFIGGLSEPIIVEIVSGVLVACGAVGAAIAAFKKAKNSEG